MMPHQNVTIIGAGLAGSLLSIYLARRGFSVTVFEARGDMRSEKVEAGRSINLALSDRGIAALREVGMDVFMLSEAVPMRGRMIHSPIGEQKLLPYSGREGEYINSVSRSGLNIALMNEAEKYPNVSFIFGERCTDFDTATGEASFASGRTFRGDTVIATDGAGSPVRQAMQQQIADFDFSSRFLDHGYKELHIPPGPDGSFLLEKNALHIWPRHRFMMIALPNHDGSFTCTLFLAHKGGNPSGSEGVLSDAELLERFETDVEHTLIQPTFIIDFPKSISPLSKASPENPQIAERFELFINGMEVANGFSELNDPREQYDRFADQMQARERGDEEAMVLDEDYIRALSYGMPPAAGIGIGIDRLTMLLTNKHSIRDVILFPHMRPERRSATEDTESAE